MEIEKIENILEALLFMSGDSLKLDTIAESLELQKSEVKKAIASLKEKYGGQSGVHLITFNNNVQFCTNPEYDDEIAKVLNPIREKELSNATLETITVIAYKQPVTKLDIENIRGVNCDYTVQVLLKLGLIEVKGRKDSVGHPLLFGTTDEFLKRFRIESISKLPDYETLLQSIESLRYRQADTESLYNEFEIPEDEKPDFLEGEDVSLVELDEAAATTDEPEPVE